MGKIYTVTQFNTFDGEFKVCQIPSMIGILDE